LEGLDLAGCADTFVGNSDVRYVLWHGLLVSNAFIFLKGLYGSRIDG
jgi:hypothetical protein